MVNIRRKLLLKENIETAEHQHLQATTNIISKSAHPHPADIWGRSKYLTHGWDVFGLHRGSNQLSFWGSS